MATNIPPHNLGEVCTALIRLLENDELGNAQLCKYIKGPDFPTGGQILNSPEEIKAMGTKETRVLSSRSFRTLVVPRSSRQAQRHSAGISKGADIPKFDSL